MTDNVFPKWYRIWYRIRGFRRKMSLEEAILSMHPIFYMSPYKGHSVVKCTFHWFENREWHEDVVSDER